MREEPVLDDVDGLDLVVGVMGRVGGVTHSVLLSYD